MNRATHLRILCAILATAALALGAAHAQNRVKTETIKPAPPAQPKFENQGHVKAPGSAPDIITDLARLPPGVARTRERILEAARSGDLQKLVAVMRASPPMPIFSVADDTDPIAFWKANYPDSDGIEALSILVNILEMPFVHVDLGTAQEIYLWPYLARLDPKTLTPEQRVDMFRVVTGADYKEMLEFGAYSFYRLGIAPDGSWQFFVSGD